MIELEKKQRKPGYKNRIKGLEMMRDQVKQLNDLSKANDITQLFPTFNSVINELKSKSKTNCIIF